MDGYMPYLADLGKTGNAFRLNTILAFDGIAPTAYTGVYPDSHSIWTQFVLDENGQFNWLKPFIPVATGLDKLFSLSQTSKKIFRHSLLTLSKMNGRLSGYPSIGQIPLNFLTRFGVSTQENFLTTDSINSYPTFLSILRKSGVSVQIVDHPELGSDNDVVESALEIKRPSEVTFLRLWDLDSITHRNGVKSEAARRAIKENDQNVKRVVEHFQQITHDTVNVLVFADHGMVNVKGNVDLVKTLNESGLHLGIDYLAFLDSTIARFWAEDDVIRRIGATLQYLDGGRILNKKDLQTLHIPATDPHGKLLFLADPGIVIRPNFFQGAASIAAMHGYDPSTPDMDTIFVTNIPNRRNNKSIHGSGDNGANAQMVDIAPTILDALGYEYPSHMLGKSLLA
ncbi:MAG: alkaline phosphatase family protein [Thaumarchaeota archaeon]|nr:alkaline phosphatase family protein [Nitrososphaerota archaeon]